MEDAAIVELYWARNEDALRQTQIKYGPMLLGISASLTETRSDAEECVNDAYLAAWNAIPPAKPEKLGAFLSKIVRRLSVSRYRASHAEKRGGFVIEEELTDAIPAPGSGSPVERELENGMLKETLNGFLADLSERNRAVFLLRYFYGRSTQEIAKQTGIGESNVKVTLMRLRERLRKVLEMEGML